MSTVSKRSRPPHVYYYGGELPRSLPWLSVAIGLRRYKRNGKYRKNICVACGELKPVAFACFVDVQTKSGLRNFGVSLCPACFAKCEYKAAECDTPQGASNA